MIKEIGQNKYTCMRSQNQRNRWPLPEWETLNYHLEYQEYDEPEKSGLYWKNPTTNVLQPGSRFGTKEPGRPRVGRFNHMRYYEVRLLFFLVNKEDPMIIAAIDGDMGNNRMDNLIGLPGALQYMDALKKGIVQPLPLGEYWQHRNERRAAKKIKMEKMYAKT